MRLVGFFVFLFVVGCANATSAQTEFDELAAEADPGIQAQINIIFDAQSELDVSREVQALKESTNDKAELVKQLAIFAATARSGEEFHVLQTLGILYRLDLQPSIPIRVLAPYLDSDNDELRGFAREWFQGYDKAVGEEPLKAYRSYVAGRLSRNEEVPAEFIEYIYERLPPGKALEVFHFGRWPPQKKDNDVLLAEHIVSNAIWLKENGFAERFQKALPEAKAELVKLAKHKEWWARLYIVCMMRRYPELQQADILQQLTADSNILVSKTAKAADQ